MVVVGTKRCFRLPMGPLTGMVTTERSILAHQIHLTSVVVRETYRHHGNTATLLIYDATCLISLLLGRWAIHLSARSFAVSETSIPKAHSLAVAAALARTEASDSISWYLKVRITLDLTALTGPLICTHIACCSFGWKRITMVLTHKTHNDRLYFSRIHGLFHAFGTTIIPLCTISIQRRCVISLPKSIPFGLYVQTRQPLKSSVLSGISRLTNILCTSLTAISYTFERNVLHSNAQYPVFHAILSSTACSVLREYCKILRTWGPVLRHCKPLRPVASAP